MTKGTPYQLFVSGSTKALLGDEAGLIRIGESEVRGREARIEVWTLLEEPLPA
jgi:class 3 adenylate cyclase